MDDDEMLKYLPKVPPRHKRIEQQIRHINALIRMLVFDLEKEGIRNDPAINVIDSLNQARTATATACFGVRMINKSYKKAK